MDSETGAAVAALREVILAGERYRLAVAQHLGVTVSESQALSYLLARGPLGPTDLAEALDFTTGSTTSLIDRLERRGLVERFRDPQDRRRVTVHLSSSGEDELAEIRHWMELAFEGIDRPQRPGLAESLQVLAQGLRKLPADDTPPASRSSRPRRRR